MPTQMATGDPHPSSIWSARLPTGHELGAALRAGGCLSDVAISYADASDSYRTAGSSAMYRVHDLERGGELLQDAGLVLAEAGLLRRTPLLVELLAMPERDAREHLLAYLLDRTAPLWLSGALDADGRASPEYLPDEAARTLVELLGADGQLEAFLEARWGKVDPARDAQTGAYAEEHVVTLCREELAAVGEIELAGQVRRISLVNDRAGYDVTAPRVDRSTRHLEVKGTRSEEPTVIVYLSRNEARRGLTDPDWQLVVCRVRDADDIELLGHCIVKDFVAELPIDQPGRARWASAAVRLLAADLRPGLPAALPT